MAADFSRVRNNPLLDYAGVELKQGGVLLDADANELVAIVDRRLRALAGDVLGRATVGANTPDAFRITLGGGGLLIGRGRLYVDGLLAESHGAADPAQREFDALMAEPRFTAPIPYAAQPYLPNPPGLPEAGRRLVYLDVWNREVTHVENPALIETAVGVETSSRLQTVWQVRVLDKELSGSTTCGTPDGEVPGWLDLISPSGGRLTTGTYEVSAVTDPCELPPTGGYRGLENQLYRVEIHDAGQAGAGATFVWSRDNGSVCSGVASIDSDTTLQLDSLGRDDVLRFNTGDWVEITDDVREFSQVAGEIRKITVDEATRRISFSPALPAEMLPAAFPDSTFPKARHLRVARKDHKGKVLSTSGSGNTAVFQDLDASGSKGVINVPVAGTTLLLENGVTVSFSSVGTKGFRAGDFWVFAARTADASVELLDQAPPRGVHHHYARLAIWDPASSADPTDCRHPWPPAGGEDCGCTQCVTPESHASGQLTIASAVSRVQSTGGTVCLHAGQYTLTEPVHMDGARSVRIKGQGPATLIGTAGTAFIIESSAAVAIENLAVISLGKSAVVSTRTAVGLALHDLVVVIAGGPDANAPAVALSGAVAGAVIRDNLFIAPEGIRALEPSTKAPPFLISAELRIEDNILWCTRQAVNIAGQVVHLLGTRICGNEILGCRDAGISALGVTSVGASLHVSNNTLSVNGPGIRCGVDGAWIEGNKVTGVVQGDLQPTGSGISLLTGLDPSGSNECQVLANQVGGFPDAGILINAPAQDLIIKLNIIERCGNGITMVDTASATALSIENNHLRDIGPTLSNPLQGPHVLGIAVIRTQGASIVGNTMRRIGVQAAAGTGVIAGIAHFAVNRTRITGNEIVAVGPITDLQGTPIAGVLLRGPYRFSEINGNHIERDAGGVAQPGTADWSAVSADEPFLERPIIHTGLFSAVRLSEARTLVINGAGTHIDAGNLGVTAAGVQIVIGSSAALRGNMITARGRAPAVMVRVSADVQFGDNRCELSGVVPAVVLNSTAAVVSSNLLRGGETSLVLSALMERVTVLGNATTAAILVNQHPLSGTPWEPLNIRI